MSVNACTHRPILRGFEAQLVVALADSIQESADSTTALTIVGQLSISNMFNILNPLSADSNSQLTGNWPSGP